MTNNLPENTLQTFRIDATDDSAVDLHDLHTPPPWRRLREETHVVVSSTHDTVAEESISDRDEPSLIETGRRFTMLQKIARGGFAEVWEAEQNSVWRRVAIKRLREDIKEREESSGGSSTAHIRSFRLEALVTANLEHPNIMPVYDLGVDESGQPLMAMKLIRGQRWDEMIKGEFGKMEPRDFLSRHLPILLDIAQAVAFAHSRGIVHRDLKPSQVMLGDFGEVLLTDWGLAMAHDERLVGATCSDDLARIIPNHSNAPSPAGTLAFMAPEQTLDHAGQIGPETDVFLLGACLYQLLTGSVPNDAADSRSAVRQASSGTHRDVFSYNNERFIPNELGKICSKAMSFEKAQRYRTVAEFIHELQQFVEGTSAKFESLAISEMLEERLSRELPNDYKILNQLQTQAERAVLLWPKNDSARTRLHELTIFHARLAMDNGDLVLARYKADRLDAGPDKDELLEEIKGKERWRDRVEKQRCFFIRAAIWLIIGCGLMALYFYQKNVGLEEKLTQAEEQIYTLNNGD